MDETVNVDKLRSSESLQKLTDGTRAWLIEHVSVLLDEIVEEAEKIAGTGKRIRPTDISEATKLYAPGTPIQQEKEFGWRQRIGSSISGITLISAAVAIVFGVLGKYSGQNAQGYYDIVKVFAGAIVGSSGVSVASGLKR